MRTFLVSYDLAKPDLNGPYVADALMSLGETWARPLAHVWYLKTFATESEIELRLSRLLDDGDGLLVQETKGDAALVNTGLRWFRQRRRSIESDVAIAGSSAAFPDLTPANDPVRPDVRVAV